ncbi:putative lipoprotein NlpC [Bradyrhizobium sp. GM2.4]
MIAWMRNYVGLPKLHAGRSRDGVDCYGIVWLVYREVLNIELPSFAGEAMDVPEREDIAALIARGRSTAPWRFVENGCEREFDMAVFRRGKLESHVGLVVSPGRMLHIVDVGESHIGSYADGPWRSRIVGFHRHEALV